MAISQRVCLLCSALEFILGLRTVEEQDCLCGTKGHQQSAHPPYSPAVGVTWMEQPRMEQEELGTALLGLPRPWRCPQPWVGPGQPELGVGNQSGAEGWKITVL